MGFAQFESRPFVGLHNLNLGILDSIGEIGEGALHIPPIYCIVVTESGSDCVRQ